VQGALGTAPGVLIATVRGVLGAVITTEMGATRGMLGMDIRYA
jgi:hypothetical protein